MADTDNKPTFASKLRDLVGAAREAILVIIFVLLLVRPEQIKDVLVRAGFTELSFAGIKWQKQLIAANQQAEEAKKTVAEVSANLQGMKGQLQDLAKSHPEAKDAIGKISDDLAKVETRARTADETLDRSIVVQRNVLREIAPERLRMPPNADERTRRPPPENP